MRPSARDRYSVKIFKTLFKGKNFAVWEWGRGKFDFDHHFAFFILTIFLIRYNFLLGGIFFGLLRGPFFKTNKTNLLTLRRQIKIMVVLIFFPHAAMIVMYVHSRNITASYYTATVKFPNLISSLMKRVLNFTRNPKLAHILFHGNGPEIDRN